MKYQHLVDKLTDCQLKILDNIEKSGLADKLPDDLVKKAGAADEWLQEANKKIGQAEVPELAPNIDPVMAYANALHEYQGMFDEKTRDKIDEFNELTDLLFEETRGIAS